MWVSGTVLLLRMTTEPLNNWVAVIFNNSPATTNKLCRRRDSSCKWSVHEVIRGMSPSYRHHEASLRLNSTLGRLEDSGRLDDVLSLPAVSTTYVKK